jgi:hypothetical protein
VLVCDDKRRVQIAQSAGGLRWYDDALALRDPR